MGSPVRRHINPITRCWDQPHYRYAGTDDGRGTDQRPDTKRLTLMMGFAVRWPVESIRGATTPGVGGHNLRDPRRPGRAEGGVHATLGRCSRARTWPSRSA